MSRFFFLIQFYLSFSSIMCRLICSLNKTVMGAIFHNSERVSISVHTTFIYKNNSCLVIILKETEGESITMAFIFQLKYLNNLN